MKNTWRQISPFSWGLYYKYPVWNPAKVTSGKVFVSWKGRKFGGWASVYGYTTAELIESPHFIIESILQDELGFTNTDFVSIGDVTNYRPLSDWKYARSLITQENSLASINSLAYEAGLISTRTGSGQERLTVLDNALSTSLAITTADIKRDEQGAQIATVIKSPTDLVKNEFYLNYKYNYWNGTHAKQLFCTASADNLADNTRSNADGLGATYKALCSASQTEIGKVNRWQYDALWIRDDTTAELFLKLMMNWLAVRKWIFVCTLLYNLNTLKLELADKVKITSTLLPATVSNTRQFIVTSLTDGGMYGVGEIEAEFLMIPEVINSGYGFGYGTSYGEHL